jgi:hypothetical protein
MSDTAKKPAQEAVLFDSKQNKPQKLLGVKGGQVVAVPEIVTEPKADMQREIREKMDDLVDLSRRVLFKTTSVFPFEFFPDEIVIDPYKVNIVSREFFASERIHSIAIKEISDVLIDTGPFFAALKIIDKNFIENTIVVRYLKKQEALKARRIIQGIMIANKEELDIAKLEVDELAEKAEEIGKAHYN